MHKLSHTHKLLLIALLFLCTFSITAQEEQETEPIPEWDGQSRFSILLMGIDRRPGEGNAFSVRTDAILLLSVDPATQQIGILHIPRDIHFPVPDSDNFFRVNTLMQRGEGRQEGYGPYYVMDTLQYNLGLYVDRYVLVDFQAFEAVVNAIGGVEITLNYTIDDPTYPDANYGYDPFYLPRGTHTLNGYDALRFARTRHGDNDFVRGVRQLQVVNAIYTRLNAPNVLPGLIISAPDLLEELEGNVFTDLTLNEMIDLATFGLNMPQDAVTTGVMNEAYIITQVLPGGTRAYVPDREKLVELLTTIFGDNYAG